MFISDNEDEIDNMEIYYINLFNSNNPNFGYNLTSGGEGGARNIETKEKIKKSMRGINSNLSIEDVRKIKLALWCLMNRKEISKMFNVSKEVINQIALGASFGYVLEELNDDIYNLKQKLIDERNDYILELFDKGNSITEINKITGYSNSIVEKCVYKYRNSVKENKVKYQIIYDKVIELYNNGVKKYHIAKELKISPSTVDRYLSGKNNPYEDLSYKKITQDIEGEIIHLYFNENKTSIEIGKMYNMSKTTIMSFINNYKYANTEVS